MAYLVKPLRGEEDRMELSAIHEGLKAGAIDESWLVRDERQDFFYPVGKLIGKIPSSNLTHRCPHCRTGIEVRHIDIGLPATCPECRRSVVIPDPSDAARLRTDVRLLRDARRVALIGLGAFAVGFIVTVGSVVFLEGAGFVLWWGPIIFGLGTFLVTFPQYMALRRKIRRGEGPGQNRSRTKRRHR